MTDPVAKDLFENEVVARKLVVSAINTLISAQNAFELLLEVSRDRNTAISLRKSLNSVREELSAAYDLLELIESGVSAVERRKREQADLRHLKATLLPKGYIFVRKGKFKLCDLIWNEKDQRFDEAPEELIGQNVMIVTATNPDVYRERKVKK